MLRLRTLTVAMAVVAACGTKTNNGFGPSAGADGGDNGGPGPNLADDGGSGEGGVKPATIGHLKGKVFAPEGTIPISGALLYLTTTTPDPIPDGVYCDKCVQITSDTPYAYSDADGSFDLPAYRTGSQQIVVQKGAFRRVRSIDVAAGDQNVPAGTTTLPGKMDKVKGDDIPKMAVVVGAWDHIEASLAKLGLGQVAKQGPLGMVGLVRGTESFDLYENAWPPGSAKFDPRKIITDAQTISKYHVVFIPCSGYSSSGSGPEMCQDYQPTEPGVQNTLRNFVAAGGKLYVTDYSYEYVRQPWPGRIDWDGQTSSLGSACKKGAYDAPGIPGDKGLGDWLTAIGETNVTLQQNWTAIEKVNPVQDTDANGQPVTVTPRVWMKANGANPATVSFDRACGRVLFSTYHTEGSGEMTLLAQEKALLYILLEVAGVCVGTPPPVPVR